MEFRVTAVDRSGGGEMIILSDLPDTCPRCHRSVVVNPIHTSLVGDKAQSLFRCTSASCQELFLGNYQRNMNNGWFMPTKLSPVKVREREFQQTIAETSPTFVEIYNQAVAAEAEELTQLVGIGLRKSLEFLIKDFSVLQHPDETDAIRALQLSPCITKYVSDQNIKDCAKRAAWLGNDESHYTRKWEDKDISDLKLLVHLTTNWIDNVLLTQKYVAEMPQPAQ